MVGIVAMVVMVALGRNVCNGGGNSCNSGCNGGGYGCKGGCNGL